MVVVMHKYDKRILLAFMELYFDEFVLFCESKELDESEAGFIVDQLSNVESNSE